MSRVPPLPEYIATYLTANRKDTAKMYPVLLSLHEAGWSLASLAAPFGVSRESIRLWINRARDTAPAMVNVPGPPEPASVIRDRERRADVKERRENRLDVEAAVLAEVLPQLLALQDDASALRGPSESSEFQAAASAEYTRLLNDAVTRGASATRLARELGIQPVTIYARLRRGGYRPIAPSERRPNWAVAG